MKKWILLGIILAFAMAPAYASPLDPGGGITLGVYQDQGAFVAPLEAEGILYAAYVDQTAVKQSVQTVAGMAGWSLGALLLAVVLSPVVFTSTRRTAFGCPQYRTDSTFSPAPKVPERYDKARVDDSLKSGNAPTVKTKSELLKRQACA